jgi:GT2 family glycosyltransferase
MLPVYIIIVNYKNWQDTLECLESVFRSSYTNFSAIVIDNDSQNNSLEHLMHWANSKTGNEFISPHSFNFVFFRKEDITDTINPTLLPRLTFIQNDSNAGFAAGNNVALRFLQGQDAYFWLLNPDTVILENTLEEMLKFAARRSTNAIIGGQILSFSGNHELLFYGGATINFMTSTITPTRQINSKPPLDYISGACLFAHTSNLKKVGLLPEVYFLYWEESDWCYRARQLGCKFHVCPTAICYDKISTVIGKGFIADYFYVRNGLLFISKYRKKNLPFVLFFNVIRFFKRIFTGKWKSAHGVLKGTIDFFKMKTNEAK